MKPYYKRLLIAIILGAISGIFCIIGVRQRLPPQGVIPSTEIYLTGAWYNRVILGLMIGFAAELKIIGEPDSPQNTILRGAILGALVSLGFALFHQFSQPTFIGAGVMFGAIIDLLTTIIVKKLESRKE